MRTTRIAERATLQALAAYLAARLMNRSEFCPFPPLPKEPV